jgi:hypothetical protein
MKHLSIALGAMAILASYLVAWLPQPDAAVLLREDGPIEQATLVFFLIAGVCLLMAWRRHGPDAPPRAPVEGRRVYLLLLAGLMLVCAGEEASWGQRIFGWRTPEMWSAINAQAETNLHNLVVIEGGVRDVKTQTFLRSLTNANRLFALFWLTFFVAVPVLDRCAPWARRGICALGLPVPPWWCGALFLLNHGAFFLANRHLESMAHFAYEAFPLDELKEHNAGLVYAIIGLGAWVHEKACAPAGASLPHRG